MDEILKLYDKYYDEDLTHQHLIREVEKVMIEYKDEFKRYDDSLTAHIAEMEGYE
tara:strand:- start:91 stop:255 length:165 start_codon:yes stop_codon:yes gene_type:complete